MAVPRIPVVALLLGLGAAICGQELPKPVPPAARLSPLPGAVVPPESDATVLPPLLPVVPPEAPRKPCLPCHTEYHPHHSYLPDGNPDGAGGCDGECHACRLNWVACDLFFVWAQDLGDIHRDHTCAFQIHAGHWFDGTKTLGVEASFLNVHEPYHEIFYGNTFVNSPLTVTSGDANVRLHLLDADGFRLDGLLGYRYAGLHEHLFIHSADGFAADEDTRNTIHAVQVGLVGQYRFGGYFCEVSGKVGVGRNSESVAINAIPFTDTQMAVVPEFAARVGYQLGEGVFGTLGYSFLYLSNVARPGRGDTDFHLHGVTIGVEKRF
jgi:hypothetical protein